MRYSDFVEKINKEYGKEMEVGDYPDFEIGQNENTAKWINEQWAILQKGIAEERSRKKDFKRQMKKMFGKNYLDGEALLEYNYCKHLESHGIDYRRQVGIPNGRIDVLTDTHIIEIKNGSDRSGIFEAIGQLKYYSWFYPHLQQKIVVPENLWSSTENILKKLNIEWEVFENE